MSEGFKVADAFVEVDTKDNTERGRKGIEKSTIRWADALGLKMGGRLGSGMTSGLTAGFRAMGVAVSGMLKGLMLVGQGLLIASKFVVLAAALAGAAQVAVHLGAALIQLAGLAPLAVPAVLALASAFGTLKIAFSGFGEALKAGWSGDLEKFTEAMKQLPAPMQQVLKTIVGFKRQITDLKKSVQGAFFAGLSGDVAALGTIYLPLLQRHLTEVATAFNGMVKSVTKLFGTKAFVSDWGKTLDAVRTIIQNVSRAIAPIIDGFRHIGTVAAPILAQVTGGFAGIAQKFADLMKLYRDDGSLEAFIRNALAVGGQLLQLLFGILRAVTPIFEAISMSGGGTLKVMIDLVNQVARFLSQAKVIDAIVSIFRTLGGILTSLAPGLLAILAGLANALLALAPGLTVLGKAIGDALVSLGPALAMAGGFLSQILTILSPAIALIGKLVSMIVSILGPVLVKLAPVVLALFDNLAQAIVILGPALSMAGDFIGQILTSLAPLLPLVATLIAGLVGILGPALVTLAPILMKIFEALGQVLMPVAQILADLVTAIAPSLLPVVKALGVGLGVLVPVATLVGQAIGRVLEALAPLLPALGEMLALVLTLASAALIQLATVLQPVIKFIGDLVSMGLAKLLPVINDLVAASMPRLLVIFNSLTEILKPLLPLLLQMVQIFAEKLIAAMPQLLSMTEKLVPVIQEFLYLLGIYFLQALTALMPYIPELINLGLMLFQMFVELAVALLPLLPDLFQLALIFQQLILHTGLLEAAIRVLEIALGVAIVFFKVLSGVIQAVVWWVETVNAAVKAFWEKLKSTFGSIKDWFAGLPATIGGYLSGFANLLYDKGKNLIQGLWNGISSMAGWLRDKISGFLSSNIPGVVKQVLGISSPSKVMAGLGRWVPAGLAAGMTGNMGPVVDAATRLAAAAIPALSMPTPSLAGSPGYGAGVNGGRGGDTWILADFGDGVKQLVKGVITSESATVAASTDEGHQARSYVSTPRARI